MVLLNISKDLNYKVRSSLQIHNEKEHESIFVEVLSRSHKNIIVGCTYKHPNMAVEEFNDRYLQPLFDKLANEKNDGSV